MKSLKEKHPHGDALFPFEFFDQSAPKGDYIVYVHWHPETEWIYVLHGSVLLSVDSREFILKPGDFIAVEPKCLHYLLALEDCRYYTCVFDKELLRFSYTDGMSRLYIDPYIEEQTGIPEPVCAKETTIPSIYEHIARQIREKKIGRELSIRLALLAIVHTCIEEQWFQKREKAERNVEAIATVLQYVHDHYDEKLTSQGLAGTVRYNPQYFSRFFKECTGFAPIEYVNRYRIDQACRLLIDPARSILSVSMECGFDSCSYFIRKFKAYKNMSPSEYRKAMLGAYNADWVD